MIELSKINSKIVISEQGAKLQGEELEQARLKVLISSGCIKERVKSLSKELGSIKDAVFICVLSGSVIFFSDLVREIKEDVKFDFVRLKSYSGKESTGAIELIVEPKSVEGKNIFIIEDIIDTGRSLSFLVEYLKHNGAKSVKTVCLLDKPSRRTEDITPDYTGFEIPDLFIVGYGLDHDEEHRNLPYIGVVE